MIPNIIRRNIVAGVNYFILHELACHHVEQKFKSMGEIPPTWLIACESDVLWVETPWDDDNEKVIALHAFRELMKELKVHCYAQISEEPDKYRDDIVQVFSFDKTGNYSGSRYKVTVRRQAINFLGPRVDIEETGFEGRMWNLLQDVKQ